MSKNVLFAVLLLVTIGTSSWYFFNDPQPAGETAAISGDAPSGSLSYMDILNNSEFVSQMQHAVLSKDTQLAKSLQAKALEIAHAAQLPDNEIELLSGDKGLDFMTFLAKRQLFAREFEQRYYQLESIETLKQTYPEARDLFAKSDLLIAARDAQIFEIAESLADGGNVEAYITQAKQQWMARQASEK